jgi:hypothetical protein
MYRLIGGDGREYGPVTLDQLKVWVSESRVNVQTRVLAPGHDSWKPAAEIPEVAAFFNVAAAPGDIPPLHSARPAAPSPQPQRLAVTSLVLGLLALLCIGPITGLPAIFTGHVAYSRNRRDPVRFGGGGLALAGLLMGYCSLVLTAILLVGFLPAFYKAQSRSASTQCQENLKLIGVGILSADNVSEKDLAEEDPVELFRQFADQLGSPRVLICPADKIHKPAADFDSLTEDNISYQLAPAPEPQAVLRCPIHRHALMGDGSVTQDPPKRKRGMRIRR